MYLGTPIAVARWSVDIRVKQIHRFFSYTVGWGGVPKDLYTDLSNTAYTMRYLGERLLQWRALHPHPFGLSQAGPRDWLHWSSHKHLMVCSPWRFPFAMRFWVTVLSCCVFVCKAAGKKVQTSSSWPYDLELTCSCTGPVQRFMLFVPKVATACVAFLCRD